MKSSVLELLMVLERVLGISQQIVIYRCSTGCLKVVVLHVSDRVSCITTDNFITAVSVYRVGVQSNYLRGLSKQITASEGIKANDKCKVSVGYVKRCF